MVHASIMHAALAHCTCWCLSSSHAVVTHPAHVTLWHSPWGSPRRGPWCSYSHMTRHHPLLPPPAGLDGNTLVDLLLELLEQQLAACFGLRLQPGWVLELDSSTEAKFSRHLHVRIPGHAFEDNFHVGAFVRRLCALALEGREVAGGLVPGEGQGQAEQQGQQGQPEEVQGPQCAAGDVSASAEQHQQQQGALHARSQSHDLEQQGQQEQEQQEEQLAAAGLQHAATSHQPVSLPQLHLPAGSGEPCEAGAEGPSGSSDARPDSACLQQQAAAASSPGAAPAAVSSSSSGRYSSFVVNKENGQKMLFIDTGEPPQPCWHHHCLLYGSQQHAHSIMFLHAAQVLKPQVPTSTAHHHAGRQAGLSRPLLQSCTPDLTSLLPLHLLPACRRVHAQPRLPPLPLIKVRKGGAAETHCQAGGTGPAAHQPPPVLLLPHHTLPGPDGARGQCGGCGQGERGRRWGSCCG